MKSVAQDGLNENLNEILNLPNDLQLQTDHPSHLNSQKLKNRKSRIRYTHQSNSSIPPLPPPPIPPLPNQKKEEKKSDSLLISRPSFIGELQTLQAYYNQTQPTSTTQTTTTTHPSSLQFKKPKSVLRLTSQKKSIHPIHLTNKHLTQSIPSELNTSSNTASKTKSDLNPSSKTASKTKSELNPSSKTFSKTKSELNPSIQSQPNPPSSQRSKSTHPLQFQPQPQPKRVQERSKSTYPLQSESKIEDERQVIHPIQLQLSNEPESDDDDTLGLEEPPKLELPFFGVDQHIGCRFSVRTLTREVERSLKSHEPMVRLSSPSEDRSNPPLPFDLSDFLLFFRLFGFLISSFI
ncbi:hypothetical protein DFH28DRAFT_961254 [Melampsora americana]|nr:hypothetical protein DFH28DRAFT_961254 [Melampsora americana]